MSCQRRVVMKSQEVGAERLVGGDEYPVVKIKQKGVNESQA